MALWMMMIPAAVQGIKYRLKHFVFLMEHFHLPAPSVYSSPSYFTLFTPFLTFFFPDRQIICIMLLFHKEKNQCILYCTCVCVCLCV